MRRNFLPFLMVIISILIFYFFILPLFSLTQFLESLTTINLFVFSLALIANAIAQFVSSLRWAFLMQEVNAKQSQMFFNALGIFSIGQLAGLIVPSRVGAYVKVPMIVKMDKLSYETGISAVNAETLLDLGYICCAGIVSFFILSTFFFQHSYLLTALVTLIIGLLVVVSMYLIMMKNFEEMCTKLVAISQDSGKSLLIRTPARYIGKLFELILSMKTLFRRKKMVIELGSTTLFAQFFSVVGLYLVMRSARMSLTFPEVFAILTISFIIGVASLVPGGIGASDLSLIVLLGSEGIPIAVATNIAILWRIVMYLPIFVIVGFFLLQQKIFGKSNAFDDQ